MMILDTNVVSELIRPQPNPRITAWVDSQPTRELQITAVTVAELRAGVHVMPEGRRRRLINELVEKVVEEHFVGQVLPFDLSASSHYGPVVARRRRAGRPISAPDAQIAAICLLHGAALVTRNVDDFTGVDLDLVNPWTADRNG